MAKADYYETLGVARGADAAALKGAYRSLAMKYHPDRNPGDAAAEAKFKEVSEAYECLRDPEKRAAYDQFGHEAFQGGGGGSGGGRAGGFGNFSDIFEEVFGGGMGRRQAQGQSRQYNLEITLEDAYYGKSIEVEVPVLGHCGTCGGNGAKPGTEPQVCGQCGGAGKMAINQGFLSMEVPCPQCQGRGRMITDPCRSCRGQGMMETARRVEVQIPRGIEHGVNMRLRGRGDAAPQGGVAGDLFLNIRVAPHKVFHRDGSTVVCRVPVPMAEAALGCELEVPVLDGTRAKVKIPAGIQSGKQLRLRGKGMPVMNRGGVGDMVVEVMVETPVGLSQEQKELLERFRVLSGGSGHHPNASGFFDRVRDFFGDLASR